MKSPAPARPSQRQPGSSPRVIAAPDRGAGGRALRIEESWRWPCFCTPASVSRPRKCDYATVSGSNSATSQWPRARRAAWLQRLWSTPRLAIAPHHNACPRRGYPALEQRIAAMRSASPRPRVTIKLRSLALPRLPTRGLVIAASAITDVGDASPPAWPRPAWPPPPGRVPTTAARGPAVERPPPAAARTDRRARPPREPPARAVGEAASPLQSLDRGHPLASAAPLARVSRKSAGGRTHRLQHRYVRQREPGPVRTLT